MREDVPLAAPILTVQVPAAAAVDDTERSVAYPDPGPLSAETATARTAADTTTELSAGKSSLSDPAWEAFYVVVYITVAVLVEVNRYPLPDRIAASLALAAMIPWYVIVGRPIMRLNEAIWFEQAKSLRGPVYLAGLIALFAVVEHANVNAWYLAFVVSPQCFQVTTPFRRSMAFVVVFNVLAGTEVVIANPNVGGVVIAVATAAFSIGFSQVFSLWTGRVIQQHRERAALIAELRATQEDLAAANHEAGVLAERQRLAAEIHDTLAQGFLSIVTLIQAAQGSCPGDGARDLPDPAEPRAAPAGPPAGAGPVPGVPVPRGPVPGGPVPAGSVREYLDLALATARDNLAEARALVTALAPASLDSEGLADAVQRAVAATRTTAHLETAFDVTGPRRHLPTSTAVVLLRVAQESLANVRKHAAATRVDVRLRYLDTAVELSVTDNGRGFAPAPPADPGTTAAAGTAGTDVTAGTAGFGLRGMGERVRQAGGALHVTSAPGAGTTIRAEVPV